ncbi:Bug family tripartite tricarboxylate transporter substrate binding protein [Pseudorhodoplanes sp.]|uniref:Bug family tripartite tricarboxylate transporter substrate binding protein n=1 Tax=Pseudorhodoplanes sp. TaxID=1934341 RepID=UPI00391C8920
MPALGVLCALAASALAQPEERPEYPSKPIQIIVAVPAGGGVDIATRIVADRLRAHLGQNVILEHRGGQGGNIGAEAVANAVSDGYTLLATPPAPLTTNKMLYRNMSFDPKGFEPVAVLTMIPNVLVIRTSLPFETLEDFIAYARANPGKLNYASQGNGSTAHLSTELLQRLIGTRFVHVPYRGTAPAMKDVIAGHVDMFFVEAAVAIQQHKAGKARILAVATTKRLEALPQVPTFAELGFPDLKSATWNAIVAPPGTPRHIVGTLNRSIDAILKMPDVREQFLSINMQPVGGTPGEMAELIRAETKRWGEVIAAAGITID